PHHAGHAALPTRRLRAADAPGATRHAGDHGRARRDLLGRGGPGRARIARGNRRGRGARARARGRGEYWRLMSATLLHGSLDHLVGNAIALFILGMVCEHAFGRGQLVVLYVASGLTGSLASLMTSPGPSVGASGAIFGLQSAAIVLFRT